MKAHIIKMIRKLRYFWFYNFDRDHLIKSARIRKGFCKMCGKCCEGCVHLLDADKYGKRKCKMHIDRPRWCHKDFPIDKKDSKLKGIKDCGYYWD